MGEVKERWYLFDNQVLPVVYTMYQMKHKTPVNSGDLSALGININQINSKIIRQLRELGYFDVDDPEIRRAAETPLLRNDSGQASSVTWGDEPEANLMRGERPTPPEMPEGEINPREARRAVTNAVVRNPYYKTVTRAEPSGEYREQEDEGGWKYHIYEDGSVKIVEAPSGSKARGLVLKPGNKYQKIIVEKFGGFEGKPQSAPVPEAAPPRVEVPVASPEKEVDASEALETGDDRDKRFFRGLRNRKGRRGRK